MLREIFYKRIETDEEAYRFSKELGIVKAIGPHCEACGEIMMFERGKIRNGIDGRYRCRRPFRHCQSLLYNTIFSHFRMPFRKMIELIYFYAEKKKYKEIEEISGIDESTIISFFSKLKTKILEINSVGLSVPYPDQNFVYEVDETHIRTRKYDQGRILENQKFWAVGIICRETKEIRLILTRRRNSNVLARFITSFIPYGSQIMTDGWRGYYFLELLPYFHSVVNHSINFVDVNDRSIHTNTIERLWRSLKEFLPKNILFEEIATKIKEFEVFYNLKKKSTNQRFTLICQFLEEDIRD